MTERGQTPDEAALSQRLEKLLREYSAKLDSLELTMPAAGGPPRPPEPPPTYLYKDYFPDEPAKTPEPPAPEPAPRAEAATLPEPGLHAPVEPAEPEPELGSVAPPIQLETQPERPGPVARPLERRVAPHGGERALTLGLALAAALAVFGLWRAATFAAQAPHRFFPLQGRRLAGLTGSGASLYADDDGRLLEIAMDGGARDAGTLSGGPIAGLARDDAGHFWTTGDGQNVLFEHGNDAARAVRKAYPYPNRRFSAVTVAGDSLWALDGDSGAAYQYMLSRSLLGTSLTPISQFAGTPETARAAGLSVAQGLLWVCDPAQQRVLRYRPEGAGLTPVDSLDTSPWIAPGTRIAGMALAGGYLWVLTGWPAGLHRLRLADLAFKPLKD